MFEALKKFFQELLGTLPDPTPSDVYYQALVDEIQKQKEFHDNLVANAVAQIKGESDSMWRKQGISLEEFDTQQGMDMAGFCGVIDRDKLEAKAKAYEKDMKASDSPPDNKNPKMFKPIGPGDFVSTVTEEEPVEEFYLSKYMPWTKRGKK